MQASKIAVGITRLTVSILAETKKAQIQKTLRASREEFLQKPPSRRSNNRDRETNRSFSTGIKKPGKGHTHDIKNAIKMSISKAHSFQAGNAENFWRIGKG